MTIHVTKDSIIACRRTIIKAENALGPLTAGQRRDLLLDNHDLSMDAVRLIVDGIERMEKLNRIDWQVNLAKYYAQHHGIAGRTGGWIYNTAGRPLAQGWGTFYHAYKRKIWQYLSEEN